MAQLALSRPPLPELVTAQLALSRLPLPALTQRRPPLPGQSPPPLPGQHPPLPAHRRLLYFVLQKQTEQSNAQN
jgi:hypothetical protein